jgi:glycosyltransferase involved in cell wall biosynthesis
LEQKITLLGLVEPMELRKLTQKAHIGITLFESQGINQYYSLANRFFDYMMAGIPQICVNYPLYKEINELYSFAYLIPDTHPLTIGDALNKLLEEDVLYASLKEKCLEARNSLHWGNESKKLVEFYSKL